MKKQFPILFLILFLSIGAKFPIEESPVLTPEQEKATFVLEKGLKIELVAAEPMIEDPIAMQFDENGRLWVVEMRGYMSDLEGNNELAKNGRISVLEDLNGDGLMDKSTVYLDSLVLPRAIALIKGGILVAENQALWQALDTNGDLKADTKTLIDKDYAGSTAPEHAGNGLLRNLDNFYYNAKSRFRYKNVDGSWLRDSTEFRGQYGISQDDKGRLHYNYNWSQLHADLVPANYLSRNKNHSPSSGIDFGLTSDRKVYPIHQTPAVNRGYIPGVLDQNNKLKEFTAACSPYIYRENLLPAAYLGNAFICEPAGNLLKRTIIEENDVELIATDPNPGTEFLASTDDRFRPVAISGGPEGALFIADMYKGAIQHVLYETPYLKEQYTKKGLQKYINKGRIWRIVPEKTATKKVSKWSTFSKNHLVAKLGSSSGWERDMAQKLLIEKGDKSIENQLVALIKTINNLGKLHALWTLEGLDLLKPNLLFQLISKNNDLIASNSIRLMEPFVKNDILVKNRFQNSLKAIAPKASMLLSLQIALSAEMLDNKAKFPIFENFLAKYGSSTLIKDAIMSSLGNDEFEFLKYLNKNPNWQIKDTDKGIFLEMLATAIVKKGESNELNSMISLINLKPTSFQEQAFLMALTVQSGNISKPITLEKEPAIFSNSKIEKYQKDKLNKIFEWPGHIFTKEVAKDQIILKPEEQKMFAKGRIQYLNTCSGCHGTDGNGVPRFAPKLAGSEWVTGNETRLALIVLHGIEGAIMVAGKKYDAPEILPVMPSHSTTDDVTITNILTYIRNEWGNNGGSLSRGIVGKTRHLTQGRVMPWKVDDLNEHIESLNVVK